MNKITIFISVVILIGLAGLLGYLKYPGLFDFSKNKMSATEMYGGILKNDANTILVEGWVTSTGDSKKPREFRRIEFILTPQTKYVKSTTVLTKEMFANGPVRTPYGSNPESGAASDLVPGIRISKILSQDDLFTVERTATALEIHYETVDLSQLSAD